ncbi:hypothetical protein LPTSP4_09680 [Leptospira ryugenii]|uniref:Uncharacterized protein n=1 Tax=Leptospira ryugenii TaxID=1917863 RepID=A0A2P2DXT6_9LEPT|nr:hypothetical protein LPTSP4_09680 [Leptospira ryugenii]
MYYIGRYYTEHTTKGERERLDIANDMITNGTNATGTGILAMMGCPICGYVLAGATALNLVTKHACLTTGGIGDGNSFGSSY